MRIPSVHLFSLILLACTTGVLAAMYPCGMILVLAELFRAESKSQVYGVIHEFLSNHANVAANISKFHSHMFNQ